MFRVILTNLRLARVPTATRSSSGFERLTCAPPARRYAARVGRDGTDDSDDIGPPLSYRPRTKVIDNPENKPLVFSEDKTKGTPIFGAKDTILQLVKDEDERKMLDNKVEATTANVDADVLKQKMETIEETPLVEAEAKRLDVIDKQEKLPNILGAKEMLPDDLDNVYVNSFVIPNPDFTESDRPKTRESHFMYRPDDVKNKEYDPRFWKEVRYYYNNDSSDRTLDDLAEKCLNAPEKDVDRQILEEISKYDSAISNSRKHISFESPITTEADMIDQNILQIKSEVNNSSRTPKPSASSDTEILYRNILSDIRDINSFKDISIDILSEQDKARIEQIKRDKLRHNKHIVLDQQCAKSKRREKSDVIEDTGQPMFETEFIVDKEDLKQRMNNRNDKCDSGKKLINASFICNEPDLKPKSEALLEEFDEEKSSKIQTGHYQDTTKPNQGNVVRFKNIDEDDIRPTNFKPYIYKKSTTILELDEEICPRVTEIELREPRLPAFISDQTIQINRKAMNSPFSYLDTCYPVSTTFEKYVQEIRAENGMIESPTIMSNDTPKPTSISITKTLNDTIKFIESEQPKSGPGKSIDTPKQTSNSTKMKSNPIKLVKDDEHPQIFANKCLYPKKLRIPCNASLTQEIMIKLGSKKDKHKELASTSKPSQMLKNETKKVKIRVIPLPVVKPDKYLYPHSIKRPQASAKPVQDMVKEDSKEHKRNEPSRASIGTIVDAIKKDYKEAISKEPRCASVNPVQDDVEREDPKNSKSLDPTCASDIPVQDVGEQDEPKEAKSKDSGPISLPPSPSSLQMIKINVRPAVIEDRPMIFANKCLYLNPVNFLKDQAVVLSKCPKSTPECPPKPKKCGKQKKAPPPAPPKPCKPEPCKKHSSKSAKYTVTILESITKNIIESVMPHRRRSVIPFVICCDSKDYEKE